MVAVGTITRERRTEPGGHSKALVYPRAEKVYRNLVTSSGYHGAPARLNAEPKAPPQPKTLKQVADLCLAQHPSNAGKPGTVEGYASLMRNNILPELDYPELGSRRKTKQTLELGTMLADEITRTDINRPRATEPTAECPAGIPGGCLAAFEGLRDE